MELKKILWLAAAFMLSGCGSDPQKVETAPAPVPAQAAPSKINVRFAVSPSVNPDVDGQPSPLAVRLYELKSLGKFAESDFFSLSDESGAQLGAELIGSEKYYVNPGDAFVKVKKLSPETQYIAVIAAFRDIQQAVWKDFIQIPNDKIGDVLLYIEKLKISIWEK